MPKIKTPVRHWIDHLTIDSWELYIAERKKEDRWLQLGNVGVDVNNLILRRFRCDTHVCAIPCRIRGRASCCIELCATVTHREQNRLRKHWKGLKEIMVSHDPTFEEVEFNDLFEVDTDFSTDFAKRDGQCIFAYDLEDESFLCGIHSYCLQNNIDIMTFKPLTCLMFPLVVTELDHDNFILSVYSQDNKDLVGFDENPGRFACLRQGADGPPAYTSLKEPIVATFGEKFYERLHKEAQRFIT